MRHRVYTRRTNSNGENVAPTICATFAKLVQRQLDNAGGYVLDRFRRAPLQSTVDCDIIQHTKSNKSNNKENI